MSLGFQLGAGRIAAMVAAIVFEVVLPLVLALVVRHRLGIGWRYFGYGALIFLLFQLVSRIPITLAIQAAIAPQLQASRTLLVGWLAVAALSAGVFEEVGRYIGYRWLMKREEKTWPKAIMYGLGHGGLESMLFVAGLTLLTLINLLVLPSVIGTLPDEQRALVVHHSDFAECSSTCYSGMNSRWRNQCARNILSILRPRSVTNCST
jgi:uncharacterized membrane protein YhfC